MHAEHLAQNFFVEAMRSLNAEAPSSEFSPDAVVRYREELQDRLALYRGSDPSDDRDHLVATEIAVLRAAGFRVDPTSEARSLLRNFLQRALVQIEVVRLARLDGSYADVIGDRMFLETSKEPIGLDPSPALGMVVSPTSVPVGVTARTVKEAADQYLKQLLVKSRAPKTQDRYRNEVRHIVGFFGASTPMWKTDALACDSFRNTFSLLPPNFEDKLRKGATLAELADKRSANDPVLAWATLNKYLSQLARFLQWAHARDLTAKMYGVDLKPLGAKPQASIAKLPFEDADLRRIFARPIYTGCQDDRYGFAKPGDQIIRRARYWAPLIALYSGLRCGEILQLTPDHFRSSPAGNPFIVLTPDMALKNENAAREIPVHPVLSAVGLLDWVGRRRSLPSGLLFPEVPAHSKYETDNSSRFSKWYQSDLKYFGLGERRAKLTFHSFRHTFKNGLDRADVREDKKDEICGWARSKKQGRRYGIGLEADVLKSSVDAVDFDFDPSPLFSHSSLND